MSDRLQGLLHERATGASPGRCTSRHGCQDGEHGRRTNDHKGNRPQRAHICILHRALEATGGRFTRAVYPSQLQHLASIATGLPWQRLGCTAELGLGDVPWTAHRPITHTEPKSTLPHRSATGASRAAARAGLPLTIVLSDGPVNHGPELPMAPKDHRRRGTGLLFDVPVEPFTVHTGYLVSFHAPMTGRMCRRKFSDDPSRRPSEQDFCWLAGYRQNSPTRVFAEGLNVTSQF